MVIQPNDESPFSPRKRRPMPPADMGVATRVAQAALASIDWSKGTIVLWLNGTGDNGGLAEFMAGMQQATAGAASLVKVGYPATFDYRASVSVGIEAFRQILAGVAAHGGRERYRVLVGGESQGAWVVGDTLADPAMRAVVTRAVLVGHPSTAMAHYHGDSDPGVIEINHRLDPITEPVAGDIDGVLDAVGALIVHHNPLKLWRVVPFVLHNPLRAVEFLQGILRGQIFGAGGRPGQLVHDPHNYRDHMDLAIRFLLTGDQAAQAPAAA